MGMIFQMLLDLFNTDFDNCMSDEDNRRGQIFGAIIFVIGAIGIFYYFGDFGK